jgi:hypothetical protein
MCVWLLADAVMRDGACRCRDARGRPRSGTRGSPSATLPGSHKRGAVAGCHHGTITAHRRATGTHCPMAGPGGNRTVGKCPKANRAGQRSHREERILIHSVGSTSPLTECCQADRIAPLAKDPSHLLTAAAERVSAAYAQSIKLWPDSAMFFAGANTPRRYASAFCCGDLMRCKKNPRSWPSR